MGFKAHDLGRLQAPGGSGLFRRLAADARPAAAVEAPGAKGGAANDGRNKGGRPREIEGKPWEAEDPPVSRRTWERRQRAKEAKKPKGRSPRRRVRRPAAVDQVG
jgi:hypothetical protein